MEKKKKQKRWALLRHRMQWMIFETIPLKLRYGTFLIKVTSTPAVFVHGISFFAVSAVRNKLEIRFRFWCMSKNGANRVNTATSTFSDRCLPGHCHSLSAHCTQFRAAESIEGCVNQCVPSIDETTKFNFFFINPKHIFCMQKKFMIIDSAPQLLCFVHTAHTLFLAMTINVCHDVSCLSLIHPRYENWGKDREMGNQQWSRGKWQGQFVDIA